MLDRSTLYIATWIISKWITNIGYNQSNCPIYITTVIASCIINYHYCYYSKHGSVVSSYEYTFFRSLDLTHCYSSLCVSFSLHRSHFGHSGSLLLPGYIIYKTLIQPILHEKIAVNLKNAHILLSCIRRGEKKEDWRHRTDTLYLSKASN